MARTGQLGLSLQSSTPRSSSRDLSSSGDLRNWVCSSRDLSSSGNLRNWVSSSRDLLSSGDLRNWVSLIALLLTCRVRERVRRVNMVPRELMRGVMILLWRQLEIR